ncbi:hypothetical protein PGN_1665 [Porphyromonas gingivalis ATCC 33277]|uniref:Uncharacterized protein n=1 Tax=Porphyromonas gingivalis (strain ATCC 33277 / DSM 20709 / CIP 103683 / JCM 12257 / NCTC 11834 / 2561) TaxID=431947 RepID=B2RLD9_PORG3|nr:hypothetical protein PGN_1665 [Porphyromonas gingivalis ATCC 33277]
MPNSVLNVFKVVYEKGRGSFRCLSFGFIGVALGK